MTKEQETWLRKYITESVEDTLRRMGVLNEMAVPLKKYTERVDGLRFQLVENWCLCDWCSKYDRENPNFNHWLTELKSCMNNLKFLSIKKGIDKRNTLARLLIDDYDYDDAVMIANIVRDKFENEHITDPTQIETVAKDFAECINDTIEIMAMEHTSLNAYMTRTFNNA